MRILKLLIPAGITVIMTIVAAIRQRMRMSKRYAVVDPSPARPKYLG